jgi:hypothetical protein
MLLITNAHLRRPRLLTGTRAVLLATACAWLNVGNATRAAAQSVSTPSAGTKAALRGQTWDSIKDMPDWSGMWTPGRPPASATPPRPPAGAARPPAAPAPGATPPAGFVFGANVPLTPKYAALRDARMVRVRGDTDKGVDDVPLSNSGLCLPNGTPGNMAPVSHEYVFQPGRVIILLENSEIRRIWTDGRGHPSDDVSNPSFSGHSIGHWEGDTLVADTKDIYPEAELFIGQHVTEKTVVKERISLAEPNKLRIDTVVEDTELFTRPWTYTRWYDREIREAVDYESCTEADRAQKGDGRLLGIDFTPVRPPPGAKP